MNHKQFLNCLLTAAILLCALTNVRAQAIDGQESNSPSENVILQWNRVLTETIRTPGAHPSATIFPWRSYAMMHAAMFDAVNSIDGGYTPYLSDIPSNGRASREAAAAQAAHNVLVALYPRRQEIFAAELAKSLDGIPANRARQGSRVGGFVAAHLLAVRTDDGWTVTPPPYVLPPTPGNWQLAPGNTVATFTHYPAVRPFAIMSNVQFAPPPPPALTSAEYAVDFNEVKAIGSVNSQTRTADQTLVARLWASVNTTTTNFLVWNNLARSLAVSHNLSTIEMARLFALFNFALHDTLLTTFTSKFVYGLWRPVTAIRRADEDGNPDTAPDANWLSLITNPPYPAYAGNNAAMGRAHSTIFALFFGRDDIAFQHTWENSTPGAPGWTRSYASFSAMANEQAESRIYAGIHYRFDNVAGQAVATNVANYIFLNFMRPRY